MQYHSHIHDPGSAQTAYREYNSPTSRQSSIEAVLTSLETHYALVFNGALRLGLTFGPSVRFSSRIISRQNLKTRYFPNFRSLVSHRGTVDNLSTTYILDSTPAPLADLLMGGLQ